MLPLLLALFLPRPAAALDYELTLRLERPGESRRFTQLVRLNESYNTVYASSDSAHDTVLVNVMPTGGTREGRVTLLYQVEWDFGPAVVQVQDASELSDREEAVLSAVDGAWSLSAKVGPAYDLNPCTPPALGGGYLASLRGPGLALTRRTTAGSKSNVYYQDAQGQGFSFSLSLEEADQGKLLAGYRVERGTNPSLGDDLPALLLTPGVEARLPGTDFSLSLVPAPESAPPPFSVRESREGDRLRHEGRPLSFAHPKAWAVRPLCDASYKVKGWTLDDTTAPVERRSAVRGWGDVVTEGGPLESRAREGAERFGVGDGRCAFWTEEGMASAACDFANGLKADWHMMGATQERAAEFRHLVSSLRLERLP